MARGTMLPLIGSAHLLRMGPGDWLKQCDSDRDYRHDTQKPHPATVLMIARPICARTY